jgi:hypothetical protein
MKVFGGCFETAESFRYELKRGMPESGLSILGFIVMSIVGMVVVMVPTMYLTSDNNIVKLVGNSYLWLVLFTFLYNVFKAAFECFIAERARLFEILRDSK